MSAPLGVSPYQQLSVEERMPSELQVSDRLVANSVVERRENAVRFFPTSSQDYAIGAGATQRVITIPMSSSGYIDAQTGYISCEVECAVTNITADTTGARGIIDNGGLLCLIEEATLFVGGQMLERIRQPGVVYNALASLTETQDHHNHSGSFKGEWIYGKYSEGSDNAEYTAANSNSLTSKIVNRQNASKIYSEYAKSTSGFQSTDGSGGSNQYDVGFRGSQNGNLVLYLPLSSLFGLFRLANYIPLRNYGQLTIQLRLHSDLRTCLVNLQTDTTLVAQDFPAGQVVNLKRLALSCDVVYPNSALVASMDALLQNDATGMVQKVDTYMTQDQNFTGTADINQKSINFQVGTRYLKMAAFVFRTQADLVRGSNFSQSAFPNMGYSNHRLFINGVSIPEGQPTDNAVECYAESVKSLNMLGDVDSSGLIPYPHYLSDVSRTGIAADDNPVYYTGKFVIGVNLDQVLQSGAALQGINTLAGQSVIRLEVTNRGSRTPLGLETPDSAAIATGIFYVSRILQLRMNAVEVSSS